MISSKNRVQEIKNKFESLNHDFEVAPVQKQLYKHTAVNSYSAGSHDKENKVCECEREREEVETSESEWCVTPNNSYLYSKGDADVKNDSEVKKLLSRQASDPGKKLQRSHAFRCDRSQKINHSPKRHGSCNGRAETSDFTLKMGEKKLSKDRLRMLGNFIEDQMRRENLKVNTVGVVCEVKNSIPDSQVPKHILDQYAKVVKAKAAEEKQDAMTDSGVSSETENLDDDKSRVKKLVSEYEKPEAVQADDTNLHQMNNLSISSETMRLERKNPHLTLTDTLKKALKQPLPAGPPPKKPPRTFIPIAEAPEKQRRDPKKMLEKLEQVLQSREAKNKEKNIYDVAEADLSEKKPKEVHYLCTEILDITHRTLLPNQSVLDPLSKCFNSLNCAIVNNNSTTSLPYSRLNSDPNPVCSCSNDHVEKGISSFANNTKCAKCHSNDQTSGFKCHLNCKCRLSLVNSEFYLAKEHIYDTPFSDSDSGSKNKYGSLNLWKNGAQSKSLEDLRVKQTDEDTKIYDIPCEPSRPPTPETKTDFQKLRENFENSAMSAPALPKTWKSSESISDGFKTAKRNVEKVFGTEGRRRCMETISEDGKFEGKVRQRAMLSLPRDRQLDADRENLKRLMTEINETVSAACDMEDHRLGSFPTEHADTTEESVKLTRSLTEKRKNYVRRVSSRVLMLDPKNVKSTRFRHQTSICSYKSEILDNPYSTFRSWKSFRTSQNNLTKDKMERLDMTDSKVNLTDSSGNILSMHDDLSDQSLDNLSIDEKTGCVDIELPFEPREMGLFNVCLLVGLNYMTGEAYVKSVFPSQVQVPAHIENLIFPETLGGPGGGREAEGDDGTPPLAPALAASTLCYSLVLTDERGERSYGYCRRVLPEGAAACLPLCYCLIGKYRAPGLYYKILQEIESHHGDSDIEMNQILQQLFETDFPAPGEQITITYTNVCPLDRHRTAGHPVDVAEKAKTLPDTRKNCKLDVSVKRGWSESLTDQLPDPGEEPELPEYYDVENNNSPIRVMLDVELPRVHVIKRGLDPRLDEHNLSVLLDSLGAGLVIKVFSSLLLERKVIILGDRLSVISSCMEGLQQALYPLVWQQPLISTLPRALARHVLEAPLPLLAGMLAAPGVNIQPVVFDEGMLIDLTHPSKVLFYQGDESTILPAAAYKTLKSSLQMESTRHKEERSGADDKTRNVMISEAFLRFFVDIIGDLSKFFVEKATEAGDKCADGVVFDKEAFIKSASSKQNQYFLEWFTETAMFTHYLQNVVALHHDPRVKPVDAPLPHFYDLYNERVRSKTKYAKRDDKTNYKSAMNKKVKLLKSKLRDLVA